MVRIRLRRVGSKKQPSYRIVAIDRKKARDAQYLEALGNYNPRTRPRTIVVKEDRVLYWLSVGAQPSDTTKRLLTEIGTMDRFTRLKAGEALETLVAEAEAAAATREVSPKTRYDPPTQSAKKKAVAENS